MNKKRINSYNLNLELFISRLASFAERHMSEEYIAPLVDNKMVPHFNETCSKRDYIAELKQGSTIFMHFSTSCGYGSVTCADGLEHENLFGITKADEDCTEGAIFVGYLLKNTDGKIEINVATELCNNDVYSIRLVEDSMQEEESPTERFISQCSYGGEQRVLNIILDKDGVPYSDFGLLEKASEIVKRYKDGEISAINVSTGNIIEALRVMVSRGELNYNEFSVTFEVETITLDKLVNYSNFPKGFMDWEKGFLREIIETRIGRKLGKEGTSNK